MAEGMDHYIRLVVFAVEGCPQPLVELFLKKAKADLRPGVPYSSIDSYMQYHQPTIQTMLGKRFIRVDQLPLILPGPTDPSVDISKWDISLLTTMLQNIFKPLSLQEQQYIGDIRSVRNELLHKSGNAELDDSDFAAKWNTLETAVSGLAQCVGTDCYNEMTSYIKNLKTKKITSVDPVLESMRENFKLTMKRLRKKEYQPPDEMEDVKSKFRRYHRVSITGKGSLELALTVINDQDIKHDRCVQVTEADECRHVMCDDVDLVLCINPFGKDIYDEKKAMEMTKQFDRMLEYTYLGDMDGRIDVMIVSETAPFFEYTRLYEHDLLGKVVTLIKPTKEDEPIQLSVYSLPVEILRMDTLSIELYQQILKEGKEAVNTIRVMVVGQFDVGKTALTRRLLNEHVDIDKRDSTNGIEVHIRRCKVSIKDGEWTVFKQDDKSENTSRRLAKLITQQQMNKHSGDKQGIHMQDVRIERESDIDGTHINTHDVPQQNVKDKIQPNVFNDLDTEQDVDHHGTETNTPMNEDAIIEQIKEVIQEANKLIDSDYADLSIWDFAGQYAFYATHQVFLSRRAIYLLVTDISKPLQDVVVEDLNTTGSTTCSISEYIEFWLNSIHEYCSSPDSRAPPVILVGTHADKLDEEKKEELTAKYFDDLRELVIDNDSCSHLVDADFTINNAIEEDPNLTQLKDKIFEVAKKQQYWGELIPARWITLEKTIIELRCEGLKICERKTLLKLNQALPVPLSSDKEVELFLRFHHDSGNILYLRGTGSCVQLVYTFGIQNIEDTDYLSLKSPCTLTIAYLGAAQLCKDVCQEDTSDNIFLDPQWVIDSFKCLITAEMFIKKKPEYKQWLEFNKTGKLKKKLIDAVWKETEFYGHRDHLLTLLEQLDIIARPQSFVTGEMQTKTEDYYFAPCALKHPPPKDIFQPNTATPSISTSRLCFSITNKGLPVAMFNRLIAACLKKWPVSKQGRNVLIFCGCGVFDVDRQHRLTLFFSQEVIQIWVTKFAKEEPDPNQDVCMAVRTFIEGTLTKLLKHMAATCDFKKSFKCPNITNVRSDVGMFDLEDVLNSNEVVCHCNEQTHVLTSAAFLKHWNFKEACCEDERTDQVRELPPAGYGIKRPLSPKLFQGDSSQNIKKIKRELSNVSTSANLLKKETDNTLGQAEVNTFAENMKSVGSLINRNGPVGTVFRVGSKYLMTNWHVVRAIVDPENTETLDCSRLEDEYVYANFDENTTQRQSRIVRLSRDIVFKDEILDVAVLEVRDPSPDLPKPLLLCIKNIEQMNIKEVSLVGFGHPSKQTKKRLDQKCDIIRSGSAIFTEAISYVNANRDMYKDVLHGNDKLLINEVSGYKDIYDDNRFCFSCFFENGGSGSPALMTNDSGSSTVVGMLSSGTPDFLFALDKSSQERLQFPNKYRFETAIRMSAIYESMVQNGSVCSTQDIFHDKHMYGISTRL